MDKHRISSLSGTLPGGAAGIAGVYLIISSLWILFFDQIAARVASNEDMLATISLYKGWGYVLITALLLYALIERHAARLSASEKQMKRVLDALPALISYIDKDLHYRFTNRAYRDWFKGETLGKHVQDVIGESTYQAAKKYIERVMSGETVRYETEMLLPHGERYISATYVPATDMDGQVEGFFTLVHDITDQKQLREEQRLWADAFEGCAHGIAIADPNTNRIVVCNPAFAKMHKSRVEDIVGSAILSLYAPSDYENVRRNVQKADQIGYARFEATMIRRDRSTFPVQMDVVSVLGEAGEVIHRVATAQDISERKQAEEKQIESEEKYRTLVEHLPAITYISRADEYKGVSYISPQIESLGFRTDAWLADPEVWFSHIHPEDKEQLELELQRFKEGGETFQAEYRLILPNGEARWFRDQSIRVKGQDGQTIFKQGFMLDITENKLTQEVLQDSEERYRLVSELTSDYSYKDRIENDGSIVPEWITDSFSRITGYSIEEALTTELWNKLVHPNDLPSFMEHARTLLGGDSHTQELRIRTKGGELRWVRDFAHPIQNAEGRVVGLYGAVQDITEYKQVEEKLRFQASWLDQINDAVIISDQNLIITGWNPAAERIYGWTAEEVIGRTGQDLLQTEFFSKTRPEVLQELRQSGEFSSEITQLRKDGSRIYIETRTVTLRDETGNPVGYVSVNRDITERKQAEDNLRRFELLSAHSRDIILFIGYEDGRILEANAAAVQAYGYTRGELLDLTIQDLRAPNTIQQATEQMAQADAGGILFETIHRRRDSTTFPVEVSSQGATISGVRTLISIVRDITERKQSEEELRLKNELLRLTSEMAKVGGWEFDPRTGKGTWTDEVARIHDLDPDVETNVEMGLSFYVAESRKKVEQAVQEAIELGKPYDLELEMITAKGNQKWIRTIALPAVLEGKVVKVQGIFQDISERKQIEQALQEAQAELEIKVQERTAALSEANALLQALMDNLPDQIYFKDRQSCFIRNSRSQANLLGLRDPSEATGKTDFDFFPDAAKYHAEEQEVMRTGKPLVDMEEWVVWPDGREMWVSTTKMPLRNSAGETIGIFGISHDITERKRADQAIRQLNADLEKQAKQLQTANKELEAFSYSVSHDLRAPLRAIDGYTRILVEDYGTILDDEGKRVCGVISREARRMGQLIDDLLSFSRLGRKEMYSSKIEMRTLVVSVLNELIKEESQERLDIHISKLPTIRGDSSLIRQVWVNMLSNALKFTSKKERAVIEVGSKTEKDEFIFYVRDNGAGFEMEYANKLFGVFQRLHTESEFSGTGVGLAIVQRIIRRHNGRVWAEGEVGKGATFYFALPRKEYLS